MDALTAERLRNVVDYNPETGVFTRRARLAQRHRVGDRADIPIKQTGYRSIGIDGKTYQAHRCAWLYVHGEWPSDTIDHLNGDRGDNRLVNLRSVTEAVNHQNLRVPKRNNKSGYLGVVAHQNRWRASVTFNKKVIRIGMFDTPEEAHAAYLAAKRKLHEGCTI
jgi:hypothetical protein